MRQPKIVGFGGGDRDTYYKDFQVTLYRKVSWTDRNLADDMVGHASLWLAEREGTYMDKYPNGGLLANVVASCRFEDYRRWYNCRTKLDVQDGGLRGEGEGRLDYSFFDALVEENEVVLEEAVVSSLSTEDIFAGIFKHLEPKLAKAFISVEIEKKSVNETAAELGTAHYNVSRWVSKAKEQLAEAIVKYPEDFGMAA